eukprot:TRINITY_DN608_c0_g1_i1.p1 TRINITY_DN608_c0_g1~~TRINITY_DN608_c0_g1_i1.p1  ORF type:complete len:214 (-),score=103.14 TRINITY_DN608_c0_g1_i1:89-670(-)
MSDTTADTTPAAEEVKKEEEKKEEVTPAAATADADADAKPAEAAATDDKKDEGVKEDPNAPKAEVVEILTLEEDEDVLFKMRARLFRFNKEDSEWKERGTGDVKFLQHKETKKVRLLMRREKTYKICANHYVNNVMKLTPNVGSDRGWMWIAAADMADEEAKEEMLFIRFANSENANLFKEKFEEVQKINSDL